MVFVDADDEVLIRRFESVRRSHPLQGDGRLSDGIAAERKLLEEAREQADVLIDTSHLNVNQLRGRVEELFGERGQRAGCGSRCCRSASSTACRPTPTSCSTRGSCRTRTGCRSCASTPAGRPCQPATCWASAGAIDVRGDVRPADQRDRARLRARGQALPDVAVGCTGGKHRSVAIAEELARRLREMRLSASPQHRDLGRE